MIFFLAILTAFASFLHEVNLAQTLSGAMGGTILRYHTGFGLFTFFLGLGAVLYDPLSRRWSSRQILATAQILLILMGTGGVFWIQIMNPYSHSLDFELFWTCMCYLPLILVAMASGFELPALMQWWQHRDAEVLGWDYVGMFLACGLYPFWFLPQWGVIGSSLAASAVHLFVLGILLWKKTVPALTESTPLISEKLSPLFGSRALLWTLSFCSMGYELLMAKVVSDLIHDEVLAHTFCIGLFFLGLAAGSLASTQIQKPLRALLRIEALLTLFAAGISGLLCLLGMLWILWPSASEVVRFGPGLLWVLIPPLWLLGFLSGYELPLLLRMSPQKKSSLGSLLWWNYSGALAAGLLVPLWILPQWGVQAGFLFLAALNLLCFGLLLVRSPRPLQRRGVLAFVLVGLVLTQAPRWNWQQEQNFLKSFYAKLKMENWKLSSFKSLRQVLHQIPNVERYRSPYQFIDFVSHDFGFQEQHSNSFTLYLNRKTQFSSRKWQTYHESFVTAAWNLSQQQPLEVLVLGAGDGLLAHELLKISSLKKLTLVELDPVMLELATKDVRLRALNQDALQDPRVEVVIDDAYSFLHRSKKTYDMIFVDFPYPTSFELSRLYSIEFYRSLYARLSDEGFFIMDAPVPSDWEEWEQKKQAQQILLDTLRAVGFQKPFRFGPLEPFVAASKSSRSLKFDYSQIGPDVSNRTFVNLKDLEFLPEEKVQPPLINSVYHPRRFF